MVFTSSTRYVCPILMKLNFSAPVQTGPGAHPAPVLCAPYVLPDSTAAGRGVNHSPPSSDKVKERVGLELHPYSLLGFRGLLYGEL